MRRLQERRPDEPAVGTPRRIPPLLLATAALVVLVDQVTKTLALETLSGRAPIDLVWTLRLRLSYNRGAAFSLGSDATPLLIVLASVLLVALLVTARRLTGRLPSVAMGLVVGGAVGNLVDRLVRGHDGAVVDFIDLQWWPVFNVADIGITVGAVLLVLSSWSSER